MKPLFSSNTEFKAATAEIASHLKSTKLGVLREAVAKAHGHRTVPAYQASLSDTAQSTTQTDADYPVECFLDEGVLVFRGFLPADKHAAPMYFQGIADGEHHDWAKQASGELTGLYGLKICEPEVVGERLYVTGYYLLDVTNSGQMLVAHDLIAGFFESQGTVFPQACLAEVLFERTAKRIQEDDRYVVWLTQSAECMGSIYSRPPEAPARGYYALSLEQLEERLADYDILRDTPDRVGACLPAYELKTLRLDALAGVGLGDYRPNAKAMDRVFQVKAVEHGFRRIEKQIMKDLSHPAWGTGQFDQDTLRDLMERDGLLADIVANLVLSKVQM